MNLPTFQRLSPAMQLYRVLKQGTFLLNRRWEGQVNAFLYLYHLPDEGRGLFVELGVDEEQDCFFVVGSFSDSEALTDYVHQVQLPD